jgi:hypothetical protein
VWFFSPFYLNQFSFSSDDARSLSLFPLNFKNLVGARNILNSILLTIAFIILIVIIGLTYPQTNTNIPELIVLAAMDILPAIFIGNLTSRTSLSWTDKTTFSWKSIYIILITSFNFLVFKISVYVFSQAVFVSIVTTIFLVYFGLYYFSFQKIVREITISFSSIAEK